MSENEIDKKKIESLLPHREPMLLIDKLTKIVPNLPIKHATFLMKTLITSEQLLLSVLKI